MSLLSDMGESLENLVGELNAMGMGLWSGDIPEMPRNYIAEDVRTLIPYLSYLMLQLEGERLLKCSWNKVGMDYRILLELSPVTKCEFQEINHDPRWESSPLQLGFEGEVLNITLHFSDKEEPPIDLPHLLERFGMTSEEGREFLLETRDELFNKSMDLQKAYCKKEWLEVRRLSHSLKGTALNLGLDSLRSLGRSVEKTSERGMLEEELLRKLIESADKVREDIARILLP